MSFPFKSIVIFLVLILVSGCINPQVVQYKDNRGWYFVKTSDTLYSIAWRYELDAEDFAAWNGISTSHFIKPGERLHTRKPANFDANQKLRLRHDIHTLGTYKIFKTCVCIMHSYV